jgi:DNA polymerase III epsilon subunit-like protein
MDPKKVLFFDLELTGFYDHDEIISITIIDGNAELVMDTLVKPAHTKKWKRTEKIHGITPDMVADSPLLVDLIPRLKEIFAGAENLIAYGVSTDYSHIKYIYETEEERKELYDKTRDCAAEFVRYIHEHRPEIEHAALIDAMDCLQIDWEGVPHSSIADTYACRKVWNALFPHYYESEQAAAESAAEAE